MSDEKLNPMVDLLSGFSPTPDLKIQEVDVSSPQSMASKHEARPTETMNSSSVGERKALEEEITTNPSTGWMEIVMESERPDMARVPS